MNFPPNYIYEVLYAKYLDREDDVLLKAAKMKQGDRVLDLCAGTLKQSFAALEMGAIKVVAVEKSQDMTPLTQDIDVRHQTVDSFLSYSDNLYESYFDVVICRQAVNYWISPWGVEMLCKMIKPGGRFVFNTFNRQPSEIPLVKSYQFNDLAYCEVSQLVRGMVHHIQMCVGLEPHFTKFRWISPESFDDILKGYFSVNRISNGGSDLYICTKSG